VAVPQPARGAQTIEGLSAMPEAVEVLLARELQAEADARTCFDARERETKRRLAVAPLEFEIPALMIEPDEEPAAFRCVGGEKDAPVPVASCFATLPVAPAALLAHCVVGLPFVLGQKKGRSALAALADPQMRDMSAMRRNAHRDRRARKDDRRVAARETELGQRQLTGCLWR